MAQGLTPMMRQYIELKEKHQDCLLFFRLGDFYEMFFEDAKTASKELDLVLTGRDCGLSERAPMCGVPYHSVDSYITRLIAKGYKVAICEQTEDPALAKGLVERDVIRIITPGTIIEERMLQEGQNNYIVSICIGHDKIGLSYADVSTGAFYIGELTEQQREIDLIDELTRLQPREIIANEALFQLPLLHKRIASSYYLERYQDSAFLKDAALERLKKHFSVVSLSGFGCEDLEQAISAGGALMQYMEETQKNALSHIQTIKKLNRSAYMQLDSSTRRNLELTEPLRHDGSKKNTLLYLLNETNTAMGSRMLRDWIDRPLQNRSDITYRQKAVQWLHSNLVERDAVRKLLSPIYDIERLCSRIVYGSFNPRDCVALSLTLKQIPLLQLHLDQAKECKALSKIRYELDEMEDISALLDAAIDDEPPINTREGGFIRKGFHPEVDELRSIKENSKQWLIQFAAAERENTGIKNLKIGFNRVFGYYIEITKSNYAQIPYHYERKQTLANAERFITPELKEMEQKILGAEEKLIALETKLFSEIRETLLHCTDRLQKNAQLLAELDCYQSLAEVAAQNNYVCPQITEDGGIQIVNGRHPIVERAMKRDFVPNSVYLDQNEDRLLIITGPNMAGKSTYMRQVALITLMAHIGSYVPADNANICMVDRIFTRIGASDDLASGQSTFMVEMSEVANILNNATSDSLLILDEVGRGTSTFDGLSIAWSVLEHIADSAKCGAKTLFATHYHELTELEGTLPGVKNYRISVKEVGDDVLFLRKIVRGSGDKSFGIQVAKLAGLPGSVLTRAKEILSDLETADIASNRSKQANEDLAHESVYSHPVKDLLTSKVLEIDPDRLSPREALDQLYLLCEMARKNCEVLHE